MSMTIPDDFGEPRINDVVEMAGHNYMVRDTTSRVLKIAAGRTDPGFWIERDKCIVVYRTDD